ISRPVSGRNAVSARLPDEAPHRFVALKTFPPTRALNNPEISIQPICRLLVKPPVHAGELEPSTAGPASVSGSGWPLLRSSRPELSRRKRLPTIVPREEPLRASVTTPQRVGERGIARAPPASDS